MLQKVKVCSVVVFLLALGGLFVLNAWRGSKIEALNNELMQRNAEIGNLKAELEAERRQTDKTQTAYDILLERTKQGVEHYAEKKQNIEMDNDACDWLDTVLPASVRTQFTGYCDQSNKHTTGETVEHLRETNRSDDEHE